MQRQIAARLSTRARSDWLQILAAADTQYMPVYTPAEAVADAHNLARGMVQRLDDGTGQSVVQTGSPVRLSATPGAARFAAPLPGAHNQTILQELGYSASDIDDFRRTGAISD
jgi:crotonobetainyl-CoA:carnitine CoA-transferase CaiB-like acyl-CoA transferase